MRSGRARFAQGTIAVRIMPTRIALAEAATENDDEPRAEALYKSVIEVGIENGQQWYVTAVYRMTRLLVTANGRESELNKYNTLWNELTKRGLAAPDNTMLALGNLGRYRAPQPAGIRLAKPACPKELATSGVIAPELGGARELGVDQRLVTGGDRRSRRRQNHPHCRP